MSYDPLRDELINLARAVSSHGIDLIVGGGYGLYLRTEHILQTRPETRFSELPVARSTEDIDLLLSVEVITDTQKMEAIRDTIADRGYEPVANYFQFKKEITGGLFVKIDLLASRPALAADLQKVKISVMRIRPHNAKNIHAYVTDEAITLTEGLFPISLSADTTVYLPHPFTYLLLKLFALRDHLDKEENKSKAKEHAADIYRTIGMMTEPEWNESIGFSAKHSADPITREASAIVSELYSDLDSRGPTETFRLLGKTDEIGANIERMISDLKTLFPSK